MPKLLTINEITQKLDAGTLPTSYIIQSPDTITCEDLIKLLAKFQDNDEMLKFIVQLSKDKSISIKNNKENIALGSLPHFIHAYSSNTLYPANLDKEKQQAILSLFQKMLFSKDELLYLLQNLSKNNVRDILLQSDCFLMRDLIAICNDVNELSKIHRYTIKLLYHYLNPTRQWNKPLTPYLDMFYFTYRAGHTLGLKNKINIQAKGKTLTLDPEGEFTSVSLKLLMNIIQRYQQIYPNAHFEKIANAIKFADMRMEWDSHDYKEKAAEDYLFRYQAQELAFIATGWTRHTVGIALYGDYLIYCNRGEGCDSRNGCKIFKIKDRNQIDKAFLEKLLTPQKNISKFETLLSTVVDLTSPAAKMKSKSHKYGTCTFVNLKSTIEGMLVLLDAGPNASTNEVWLASQKGRRNYKRFTRFIRDREIDEIIKNMFYARDPELITFYAALVKAIVTQHHGTPRSSYKDNDEVIRAYELFERSTSAVRDILQKDQDFMAIIKNITPTYEKILIDKKVTRCPGIREEIVYSYNHYAHRVVIDNGYMTAINGKATPKMHFSFKQARKMISLVG